MSTFANRDPEYPRPDFDRSDRWLSLNGMWDFLPDPCDTHDVLSRFPQDQVEHIAVPGPWESSSADGRHDWLETGWYRRQILVPSSWASEQIIVHFGAVFYQCDVWMNSVLVGSHTGGYFPFALDVTDALDAGSGELIVRVRSPRNKLDIPHGKQRSIPYDDYNGCAFTPTSGIWQTVWVEPRPATYIKRVDLTPSSDLRNIDVLVVVAGPEHGAASVHVKLSDGVAIDASPTGDGVFQSRIVIESPRPWSPDDPHLYGVDVTVSSPDGLDSVGTYTGLRAIEIRDRKIFLNGERIYIRGVLDQGYWPDSGMTAPSDNALIRDLALARDAGFNLVRKHLKAEDPRWLFHADQLGILVWSEPACTGRYSPAGAKAFEAELRGLIERDRNHPSIIIWCAYNEEWGLDWDLEGDPARRDAALRAYQLIKNLDPTRLAIDNSGWTHVDTDVLDWHYYNENAHSFHHAIDGLLTGERPEFEVYHSAAYPIPKTLGASGFKRRDQPILNSEYGGGWNSLERAWHARWQTQFMRLQDDNQGYVYTELYDIEHETVGIYTFARSMKDQAGFVQNSVHAETILVPLIAPVRADTDLILLGGRTYTIPVAVSHHGKDSLTGFVLWRTSHADGDSGVFVQPFTASKPVEITLSLPIDYGADRINLELTVDSRVIARTFIDITEHEPPSNLPLNPQWRAAPALPERSYHYDAR